MTVFINTVLYLFALIFGMLAVTAILVVLGCFIKAVVEHNEERGHRK